MRPHCIKCYKEEKVCKLIGKYSGDLVEMLPVENKDAFECPKCQHEVTRVTLLQQRRGWMSR
jgi:hypothetical protein